MTRWEDGNGVDIMTFPAHISGTFAQHHIIKTCTWPYFFELNNIMFEPNFKVFIDVYALCY